MTLRLCMFCRHAFTETQREPTKVRKSHFGPRPSDIGWLLSHDELTTDRPTLEAAVAA